MSRTTLLICVALTSVVNCDDFYEKLAFSQIFSKCFGEEVFRTHRQSVLNATKACYSEPTQMIIKNISSNIMQQNGFNDETQLQEETVAAYFGLLQNDCPSSSDMPMMMGQAMENVMGNPDMATSGMSCSATAGVDQAAVIESEMMKTIMMTAASRVSNYTCALQKLGYLDDNLTILFDVMKQQLTSLTPDPMKNMAFIGAIDSCRNFTMCLPEDSTSAMPVEIKRIVTFWNCQKRLFVTICMKSYFMEFLKSFNLSSIAMSAQEEEELSKTLLHVFWGVSPDDFKL